MKVSNISFKRIVPINFQNKKDIDTNQSKKLGYAVEQVEHALNSEKTEVYSKKEAQQIRDFFQSTLDDYNGKGGIAILQQTNGDYTLFSGKDFTIISDYQRKMSSIKNKTQQKSKLNQKINEMIQHKNKNNEIHGRENAFSFEYSKASNSPKPKLDIFRYQHFKTTSSEIIDGFVLSSDRKTPLDGDRKAGYVVYGMTYDENSLNLSV